MLVKVTHPDVSTQRNGKMHGPGVVKASNVNLEMGGAFTVANLKVDVQHHGRMIILRDRLRAAIRRVALFYPGRFMQKVLDLSGNMDNMKSDTDYTRLPVAPGGFRVLNVERSAYPWKLKQLCLMRAVSMAVMYYWLFCDTCDDQDHQSCMNYVEWLEEFDVAFFNVYGKINEGWYLADKRKAPKDEKGKPKGSPDVPDFIIEGTTV